MGNSYNIFGLSNEYNQLLSEIGLTFFILYAHFYLKKNKHELRALQSNSNFQDNVGKIKLFSEKAALIVLAYAKNDASEKIETNNLSISLQRLKTMASELIDNFDKIKNLFK